MKTEIKTFSDPAQLNRAAAEMFVETGSRAIEEKEKFTVALAGGSTPKSLFRLLSSEDFRDKIEWQKVFFFFGDERNVLPNEKESNFLMARENLLQPLKIRNENVFRWKTELGDAEKIAADYGQTIKDFFNLREGEFPRFDLIFLGMGGDGHTASLFPNTPALRENEKIAAANPLEKSNAVRLTLTFAAINSAENVIFLIKGADKAEMLRTILKGDFQPDKFPAQNIQPKNGNLYWLIDRKAAQFLN